MNNKERLRKRVLTLIKKQNTTERISKSKIIKAKLFQLSAFMKAKEILFYASFAGEVNTLEMIKEAQQLGKKIGLPRTVAERNCMVPMLLNCDIDECAKGEYGIKQPTDAQAKPMTIRTDETLIVVPGVVFDKKNNRLGRGGGYYDRFLSDLPKDVSTVGIAFDFQMIEELTCLEPHDVALSTVLTN
ncbi:MAG: 5-formyltetrahydrofolate cyclo-ligase [Candidatus Omnitrophota bacterium]